MGFNTENQPKTQRPIPPQGTHVAVCYAIIDLGTQSTTWQGQEKKIPKVHFSFELVNLAGAVFDEKKGIQPFGIFQDYTVSIGDKATLKQVLCTWGNMTAIKNLEAIIDKFVGAKCMIQVVHAPSKDKTIMYANIANGGRGIIRCPDGTQAAPLKNEKLFFDLNKFSWATFSKVPKFLQDKIRKAVEWPSIIAKYGPEPQQQQEVQQQQYQQPVQTYQQSAMQPNQNFQQQQVQQQNIIPQNDIITGSNDAPVF